MTSSLTVFVALFLSLTADSIRAETFRYRFSQGDSLPFGVSINSKLSFRNLGSLAQLLNLEEITHSAYLGGEMYVTEADPDGGASLDVEFQKVSIIMVAGDSVYTDNGSSWGAIAPGSRYGFDISDLGEMTDFFGPDTMIARQGSEIFQRFFPVFPADDIETGYQWQDSLQFALQLQGMEPISIFAQISYSYAGPESANGSQYQRIEYIISGSSFDKSDLQLDGDGYLYFDQAAAYVRYNSADIDMSALIDLAVFGLPAGMGRGTPVEIKSAIELKLGDEQ